MIFFTLSSGLPRVGLRASRGVPGASLKAATGQGRRSFYVTISAGNVMSSTLPYITSTRKGMHPVSLLSFKAIKYNDECHIGR
jgi:hypothetical protein